MEKIIAQKQCTKCKKIKSPSEFTKDKHKSSGLASQCAECKRQYDRSHPRPYDKAQYEWQIKYREANRSKIYDLIKRWNSRNPENKRITSRNRRARKKVNGGRVSSKEWMMLCEKYGNKCLCCGRSDVRLTLDHVVPLVMGGPHAIENVQPLCGSCNSKKGTRSIDYRR